MADPFNEDEELTRVIGWFKKNGLALVVGVVLGLIIIGGWQWWKARVNNRAVASAELYDSVAQQIDSGNITDSVRATVAKLKSDYGDSPYAANATFALAANAVSGKHYDKALKQLDWVIKNSDSVPNRNLARLRKARVLWAEGKTDAALKLLGEKHPKSFDRVYAELEGDIHAALGERAKAHSAYQRAVAATESRVGVAMLQRKLAQTAPKSSTKSVATSAASTQSADKGA